MYKCIYSLILEILVKMASGSFLAVDFLGSIGLVL